MHWLSPSIACVVLSMFKIGSGLLSGFQTLIWFPLTLKPPEYIYQVQSYQHMYLIRQVGDVNFCGKQCLGWSVQLTLSEHHQTGSAWSSVPSRQRKTASDLIIGDHICFLFLSNVERYVKELTLNQSRPNIQY